MKAIQKIIFFLSMAVVLVLCQEVFAAETKNPDTKNPEFMKGAQKLDIKNDDDFKDQLETYKGIEKEKEKEKKDAYKEAKNTIDNIQSTMQWWADVFNTDDNLKEILYDGFSLIGSEGFAAEGKVNVVMGKCRDAAGEDAKKLEQCQDVQKLLKKYLDATYVWDDARVERENFEKMTTGENIYFTQTCAKDAKGEDVCTRIYFKQECSVGGDCTYTQTAGVAAGCTPLPIKLAETKTCIFCPLFKVVFDAANTMATTSYSTLGRPLAMVMLIGLAIFIAFKVMILTSGFVKQDAPKFITETLTQGFKVLVAYILLYNAGQIYVYAISPVLGAGLEFGTAIMGGEYSKYLKGCATGALGASSGVLPVSLFARLDCFIRAVQEEIAIPQSMGSSLICVSFKRGATIRYIMPNFSMLFVGLIIWAFSWMVMLAFGFYLIDATIRIGIVGALMPFLIATWPFKATSKYAATGWGMLLNTFFVYVFLGIVIAVNVTLMFVSIGGADGQADLNRLINGDAAQAIKDKLDLGLSGFLVLIIGCLFGFKLTAQSAALAGSFAGGAGPDLAPKIGGLLASGATGGAKWLGGKAAKGGEKVLEKTGISGAARSARDKVARGAANVVSGIFGGGFGKGQSKPASRPTPGAGGFSGQATTPQQGAPTPTAQQNQQGPKNSTLPESGANENGQTNQGNVEKAVQAGPRGQMNVNDSGANTTPTQTGTETTASAAAEKMNTYKSDKQKNEEAWKQFQAESKELERLKAIVVPDTKDPEMDNLLRGQQHFAVQMQQGKTDTAERNVLDTQKNMNKSALDAYTATKSRSATATGKPFNEKETLDYANNNFEEVLKELDSIPADGNEE